MDPDETDILFEPTESRLDYAEAFDLGRGGTSLWRMGDMGNVGLVKHQHDLNCRL